MVYFDNAATTYPKPAVVIKESQRALYDYGANPGRSGHRLSRLTSEHIYRAREKCAEFFGADPENTVFTLNCTYALNFAIKGVCGAFGRCHVITTDLEHNSVTKPLYALSRKGEITFSTAKSRDSDDELMRSIASLLRSDTRVLVMTAGSNVTGRITPIKAAARLCREKGICLIADCAQTAGILPITLKDGVNVICAPGHKGLYGPMGTGIMATDGKYPMKAIIEGGTGSMGGDVRQPDFLPDMLESGTINTCGVLALAKGIDFVTARGTDKIRRHENALCERLITRLKRLPEIKIYRDDRVEYLPIVAFNMRGVSSEELAAMLSDKGFYLRGGLQCSLSAHEKLGTTDTGTVRFSPSVFNTVYDTARLCGCIEALCKKRRG